MTTYAWTNGARISADAQQAGDALNELQAAHGERLTPRIVVDSARPDDAPLHPCFEWDDLRAAELFREDQARHVVRCIRVVQTNEKNESQLRRVFVNVVEAINGEDEHGYVPLARVMADEGLRQQVIAQARREMESFKNRYAELTELVAIGASALAEIDRLLAAQAEASTAA